MLYSVAGGSLCKPPDVDCSLLSAECPAELSSCPEADAGSPLCGVSGLERSSLSAEDPLGPAVCPEAGAGSPLCAESLVLVEGCGISASCSRTGAELLGVAHSTAALTCRERCYMSVVRNHLRHTREQALVRLPKDSNE